MELRVATFNVLAHAYWDNDRYSHVVSSLADARARIPHLLRLIASLDADVIGLQEVELLLLAALSATNKWQLFWSPNASSDPDGCLMLFKHGIKATNRRTYVYKDGSGHIMQSVVIGGVTFANTHLLYAAANERPHAGLSQANELLEQLGSDTPAVILTDGNDRPGGPVRALLKAKDFANLCGDRPTAFVNQRLASLDLIAVRGVTGKLVKPRLHPQGIPSIDCPSDHIPMMALVDTE